MKKLKLEIDTHREDEVTLVLKPGDGIPETMTLSGRYRSEDIIREISELLKKRGIGFSGISEISVHTGPGSFTGLRVGILIARMIGFLYGIPVNGRQAGDVIRPEYGKSRYG